MERREFGEAAFLGLGAVALSGTVGFSAQRRGMVGMKITDIQIVPVDTYMFVKVLTNEGITGLGEAGAWGFTEASGKAIETFKTYLIGQDPLRIEHHWQYCYRSSHFTGDAIMAGLSAIDIALWDIAGKYFGVPCYQLMGGKTRDKARVYMHVFGDTREKLVQGCVQAKKEGFTAVGHLTPFLDEPASVPYFKTHVDKMRDAIDAVRQYREAVGVDVDLCVEIHRRLTPAEAVVLAEGIEPFHPYFYEDPIKPDNLDAMAMLAQKVRIPIATGERFFTLAQFATLLQRGAVSYVRPDVCVCGGLTAARKIAAMAEAMDVLVVPHNPLSPVSTAACIQLAACIDNFALQELPRGEHEPPKSEIVKNPLQVEKGFIIVPDAPGIGVELTEDAQQRHPYRPRKLVTRLNTDGSIRDQ